MKRILYLGLDPSRYPHQGELTHLPIIKIVPRPFEGAVKQAFEQLERYSHILLTSRSAVSLYLDHALKAGYSERVLRKKDYICVGKATALALTEKGFDVAYPTHEETAEGVIELLTTLDLTQAALFFPRSSQGRALLPEYFETNQISYFCLDLYDTVANDVELPDLASFDSIVFTSPTTVKTFFERVKAKPSKDKCIAIGPITEQVLQKTFLIEY